MCVCPSVCLLVLLWLFSRFVSIVGCNGFRWVCPQECSSSLVGRNEESWSGCGNFAEFVPSRGGCIEILYWMLFGMKLKKKCHCENFIFVQSDYTEGFSKVLTCSFSIFFRGYKEAFEDWNICMSFSFCISNWTFNFKFNVYASNWMFYNSNWTFFSTNSIIGKYY